MTRGRHARRKTARHHAWLHADRTPAELFARINDRGLAAEPLKRAIWDRQLRSYDDLRLVAEGVPVEWIAAHRGYPAPAPNPWRNVGTTMHVAMRQLTHAAALAGTSVEQLQTAIRQMSASYVKPLRGPRPDWLILDEVAKPAPRSVSALLANDQLTAACSRFADLAAQAQLTHQEDSC